MRDKVLEIATFGEFSPDRMTFCMLKLYFLIIDAAMGRPGGDGTHDTSQSQVRVVMLTSFQLPFAKLRFQDADSWTSSWAEA